MAEMLSPGVFVEEIDASTIVPTVSNSVGVFGGKFVKGPVGDYTLITSVADLITYYGEPNNENYNDFYQAYNFLQYGNKLLVSRAANVGGTYTASGATFVSAGGAITYSYAASGATVNNGGTDLVIGDTSFIVSDSSVFTTGDVISFDGSTNYTISAIDSVTDTLTISTALTAGVTDGTAIQDVTVGTVPGAKNVITVSDSSVFEIGDVVSFDESNIYVIGGIDDNGANTLTLGRDLEETIVGTPAVTTVIIATNAVGEAISVGGTAATSAELLSDNYTIGNAADFEANEASIAMSSADAKLKIIARNPGEWGNDIEVAIATPSAFNAATASMAFDGIALDDLFEYAPTGTEVGFMVKVGDDVVETFTVDFDETAKDHNNKSTYVENVINNNSSYVYVKDNTANSGTIADSCVSVNGVNGNTISLVNGYSSAVQADDIADAYDLFSNKEELDIDIVIGNETDAGVAAKNLVDTRKDAIAFIGAEYGDVVGKKAATATANLIDWRSTGSINYNNMFVVACGNYKYQYDRYNDKMRWINIAGDVAGLRAQTSTNRASWWASAGLERGQIKNVTKLAFNPTQGQRDLLYKNGINPICSFPGQGTVMWGQKTLLSKPSSFDRVNVRGLFNTMERALAKMAKYQVMEFNDNFTRNRIVSMIKPYLSSVQAGRGIQDFLVICDESNNTADVISRNQLVVDIYIKPTYVAEFIQLRFTNAGTNSFAEVIGG